MIQRKGKTKVVTGPTQKVSQNKGSKNLSKSRRKSASLVATAIFSFVLFILLCGFYVYQLNHVVSTSGDDTNPSLRRGNSVQNEQMSHFNLVELPSSSENFYASIPKAEQLTLETLAGTPSIAGVVAILQKFLSSMHNSQKELSEKFGTNPAEIIETFFDHTSNYLAPLDDAYRGRPIFDIREDDSIFMSIAAYREHLLDQTLRYAFDNAANPDKLFIGAVVQNCFGLGGGDLPCRTGVEVVGTNAAGKPRTQVSDAPPDVNGIQTFCENPVYKKYCDANQLRVLYVDENEALGPAMARYFASKLWGGETFFVQVDSHLEFAKDWDTKYVEEVKATKNYPKSVLSAYPPGFGGKIGLDTLGSKLCTCEFSTSGIESQIIRINSGSRYHKYDDRPKQIAFMAAGFFFARSEFLVDVPFDPYLPWCFMGEEITLTMRAWTSGWNIYAPRLNLIAHQYRPGRMGLPKFWESVQRTWHQPGMNTKIQLRLIQRIKNIVLYPDMTAEIIESQGDSIVLSEAQHYGLGTERTGEEYLELANINMETHQCGHMNWCHQGELE
uniref:Uncharacterized protein n=1 Tax=Eucampia antarctica TaxID=49252 RepID=A0A7S2SA14_9STRA